VLDEGQTTVKDIALAFGGMAPTTVMATKTASQLVGRYNSVIYQKTFQLSGFGHKPNSTLELVINYLRRFQQNFEISCRKISISSDSMIKK